MAGPFHGLSAQKNNVQSMNSDSTLLADSSEVLFALDKQVYLAVVLQNAAAKTLRFDPGTGQAPDDFWRHADPNRQGPGLNSVVIPPTYPHATPLSPDGTYTNSPGSDFWRQVNAMSAWQNTLVPPPAT